jgi:hypothetical protein
MKGRGTLFSRSLASATGRENRRSPRAAGVRAPSFTARTPHPQFLVFPENLREDPRQ